MSIYLPSFVEMLAVARLHGRKSKAPERWNNIAGYWPLAEGGGSIAHDLAGYGNHGSLINMEPGTDWPVGKIGQHLEFGGTNEYVSVPYSPVLQPTYSLTVSTWIRTTNDSSAGLVARRAAIGRRSHLLNKSSGSDQAYIYLSTDGVHWATILGGGPALYDNEWHQLAVSWQSGSAAHLYVDGSKVASSGNITGPLYASPLNEGLVIGVGYNAYMIGGIGPTAQWNRGLSSPEIQQLHADPHCMVTLRSRVFPAAAVTSAIMNQLQTANLGADLYNGALSI